MARKNRNNLLPTLLIFLGAWIFYQGFGNFISQRFIALSSGEYMIIGGLMLIAAYIFFGRTHPLLKSN